MRDRPNFNQICNTAILRSGAMNNKDYESLLCRLILTLIEYKKYSEFTKRILIDDFYDFYRLKVSMIMIGEIIPILIKNKIITKKKNQKDVFVVNNSVAYESSTLRDYESFINQNSILIDYFIEFAKNNNLELKKDEAEDLLANYIEDSISELGLDYIDNNQNDKNRYILYLFVSSIKENHPEFFSIYENIVIGRMLATFITNNSTLIKCESVYTNVNIFFDSGFIFNLLGLNEYVSSDEYIELVSILKGLGSKLFVFAHVFEEISNIIDSSIQWIDNPLYLPSKSSKTTEYFLSNRFTKEEIDEYVYTLKTRLSQFEINVFDLDIDYNEPDFLYEENVRQMILEEYKSSGFLDESKDRTYDIDAKSIYTIHKLRNGKTSKTIQDAKYLFVTTNRGLARVANNYNLTQFGGNNIAYAITDTYLSVLLFFTYSNYSEDVNSKFLVSAAYHAFEPSKELIRKMEKVLEEMKNKDLISEADLISWKTSAALKKYVVSISNNSAANFDESTPDRVLKAIKEDAEKRINIANQEANKRIEESEKQKEAAEKKYKDKVNEEIGKIAEEIAAIELLCNKKSSFYACLVMILIFLCVVGLVALTYYLQTLNEYLSGKIVIRILICIAIAIITFVAPMIKFKTIYMSIKLLIKKSLLNSKKYSKQIKDKNELINKLKSDL